MIRVVVADDSNLFRRVLTQLLEGDSGIKIVGTAIDGQQTVDLVKSLNPDILILDYQMPVMNGLEVLKIVMAECPLPVLMLSALTREGAAETIQALELGAVDYYPKPAWHEKKFKEIRTELIQKIIAIVGQVGAAQGMPGGRAVALGAQDVLKRLKKRPVDVIAVGSSTGGVQAAMSILSSLPGNTKPIVWVQHMPENFTASFAERLNQKSKMSVKEAENGDTLQSNFCYIAKAGWQMKLERHGPRMQICLYKETEKVLLHAPCCDVLFESVAELYGSRAIGVILTGMGDDGKKGLGDMHARGAFVVGQNAASSVVYGMAKAAYQAGVVDLELDVALIPDALMRLGAAG
ncbi:MAG TPA: chemotaxis response regulator protein-glutamate methylesterase [Candidatus Omnitrophota bacterium]|mgnify:CR=1 FL=1|nr:chemotaxis response regulator protein-glutamate methylesterase [Candidatus Omnitrophota bacterium]HPB67958.1 chemotaxis response regulator protein-glutamate methylesterase [Candidatus Omnitrophota bacterium]HQO58897.1 chemotaxis response regulator protein-glutamate methylesterase [Candidatus Omnitrophota bacterium]